MEKLFTPEGLSIAIATIVWVIVLGVAYGDKIKKYFEES